MNKTVNFDAFEVLLYAAAPYAGKNEFNEYMTATGAEFNEKSQKRIYRSQTQMSVCRYKCGCPLMLNRLSSCLKRKQWYYITQS